MSTSAGGHQAAKVSSRLKVPVAGPPSRHSTAPPSGSAPRLPGQIPAEALISPAGPVFELTPPALKGWAVSLVLHVLLLISLALWYFSPPFRRPISFDSRLAGSPNGVAEGLTLAGGLNTPMDMPDVAGNLLDSAQEPLLELNAVPLESSPAVRAGGKPSAGGGVANDNPGAGAGDGFGLARFGQGGEVIRGISVKVGDPQFTLIWDTDADLDLHVIEPGGKEIYWEDPKGRQGGELDVDNTKGLGPENIYWLVESEGPGSTKVKGPGPSGVYQWFVVYWGGFGGIAKPTHWKVRIKHAGTVSIVQGKFKALNERSRTYRLTVDPVNTPGPIEPASRAAR
jgi:hypothetical protein